jgi:hypothetical protein
MVVPETDDPSYAPRGDSRNVREFEAGCGPVPKEGVYEAFFGLRPRRACFVPFAARSATSPALTSSTT